MIPIKQKLESLTVASKREINSVKQNTKENSMQKRNVLDTCSTKVAPAKLPVIKIKSSNLLRNEKLIQQAKLIQERNSKKKLALQIIPKNESNLHENKKDVTQNKKNIVLNNISPEKKVATPVSLNYYDQTIHRKTGTDIVNKKESPTFLSPKLQNHIEESIPNTSLKPQAGEIQEEGEKEATNFTQTTEHIGNTSCTPPGTQNIEKDEKNISPPILFSYEPLRPLFKSYCKNHQNLVNTVHDDLVRPGDAFTSLKDAFTYTNTRGNKWKFYFKIQSSDNRKMKHRIKSVTMTCCFKKNADSSYQPRGIRKRQKYKTNCPCTIILHQLANNNFKAIHVCYHHDHELSSEMLAKLPARYKVASSLHFKDFKEEVLDLASLDVDAPIIHKYMENKTGQKISYYTISNYILTMKKNTNRAPRQFTAEKLKSLLIKVKELHELYGPKQKNGDKNQLTTSTSSSKPDEPFNLCKELLEIRKRKKAKELAALENSKKPKRIRNRKKRPPPRTEECNNVKETCKKSRLETTLENISDDAEMLKSVRNLQKSTADEMNVSSWPTKCFEEDQLTDVQSSEEFSYALKVYATTDSSESKNKYFSQCYGEVMQSNEMFFEELTIGTEIEVESTANYDHNIIYQEIENQVQTEDQTYEYTFQEVETRNYASHQNEHCQDFKLEYKNNETVQVSEIKPQLISQFEIEIVGTVPDESNFYTSTATENKAVKIESNLIDRNISQEGSPTHSIKKTDLKIENHFIDKTQEGSSTYSIKKSDLKIENHFIDETQECSSTYSIKKPDLKIENHFIHETGVTAFQESKPTNCENDSEYQKNETVHIQKSDKQQTSHVVFDQDGLNGYTPHENFNYLDESFVSSKVSKSSPLLTKLLEVETKFSTNSFVNECKNKSKENKTIYVGLKNKFPNYLDQFTEFVSKGTTSQAKKMSKSPDKFTVISWQTNNFCSEELLRSNCNKKCVNKETQVDMYQFDLKREADKMSRPAINIDLLKENYNRNELYSLTDEIINKHNIDSYMKRSDVAKYIEYLSKEKSMSKIDILESIYSGKAVLIKVNNSESSNQETRRLFVYKNVKQFSPLLPGDNPLCINCSNTCFHLRSIVQSLCDEIDVLKK